METQEPFFTLTYKEASNIGIFCVNLFDKRAQKTLIQEPNNENFKNAIESLSQKIYTAIKDSDRNDVILNFEETFVLQLAIADSALVVKQVYEKGQGADKGILQAYELMQEMAPDILFRLYEAAGYSTLVHDALENVFNIKTGAVRPLDVDKSVTVTTVTLNDVYTKMFRAFFGIIDALEAYQDDYEFAHRLYHHQYMNMQDYKAFRDKLLDVLEPDKDIYFTMFDNIMLYWSVSVTQRLFVSDAADLFDSISSGFPSGEFKKIRSMYMQFNEIVIKRLKNDFNDDKIFKQYMEQVDHWEF